MLTQAQINNATTEELKALRNRITSQINFRHGQEIREMQNRLYVGATVICPKGRTQGLTFVVEKINPKNVKCRDNHGRRWNITASLLQMA